MNKALFNKDEANKVMTVERVFNAPKTKVWKAWTTAEILEKWWAPKPWKAVSRGFDFKPGGQWGYDMVGPEGERHHALFEYESIDPEDRFTGFDAFCDEKGVKSTEINPQHWTVEFKEEGDATKVFITIKFKTDEDLKKITEMGFQEGFSMGLNNLDEVLEGK